MYIFLLLNHSVISNSETPWTTASHACLSFTIFWSLLKLMYIESMIHLTISSSVIHYPSCPQSFPSSESFPMSQLFTSGGQSIGATASASVFPMNIQCWFSLGLTGLIFLLSKGPSRVFSSTTIHQHSAFFMVQLSHPYLTALHVFDYMDLCWQSDVSAF